MNDINLLLTIVTLILMTDIWFLSRKKPRHQTNQRELLVDTSVLIDGRILDLAKSGFLLDRLVIPRSVLGELQLLADSQNQDKRARARFGLDVVAKLQKTDFTTVTILPDDRKTPDGVDNRLLQLAKDYHYILATLDYNLNKVAIVEGIRVFNINELARVLRIQVLPGEKLKIKLLQKGQSPNQAIGYLEDGSMVVVAKADKSIGKVVEVEITQSLQTDAGRMVFGELITSPKTNVINSKDSINKTKTKAKSSRYNRRSN